MPLISQSYKCRFYPNSRLSRLKILIPSFAFITLVSLVFSISFPHNCVTSYDSDDRALHRPSLDRFRVLFGQNLTTDSSMSTRNSSFSQRKLFQMQADHEDVKIEAKKEDPMFPEDVFTLEQRRKGAVIFHVGGVVYMFIALAIVCDEFFIPALDVITENLGISEDVAGATFMAAGGSAPELFTSLIGVFISHDDVGIGTIVGSAVFNILFVISMCAIFSKTSLELTWWPLARDVTFYSVILISLMACFKDSTITWYEAFIMLTWYGAYVSFMKYNETIERNVKRLFSRGRVNRLDVTPHRDSVESKISQVPPLQQYHRKMSAPILHGGSTKFRQGVLHLMIHSIDPLHDEPQHQYYNQRRDSSASLPKSGQNSHYHTHPPGLVTCRLCQEETELRKIREEASGKAVTSINGTSHNLHNQLPAINNPPLKENLTTTTTNNNNNNNNMANLKSSNRNSIACVSEASIEEEKKPLDVSWPNSYQKQCTYLVLAPIVIPLWMTLPDVKRPEKKKFFVGTFLGSIVWIAFYSYLMVWWASLVGETFGIPNEIMGLTFLAAGTSIPDLVTSVLVARKGFGDMAVSSSVGSNIFDVTVGLPLPWFLYSIFRGSIKVNSQGMACSVLILFIMLMFVIATIAAFKWRLNIGMAMVMFSLYFLFIVISLLLEYGVLKCSSIISFA